MNFIRKQQKVRIVIILLDNLVAIL